LLEEATKDFSTDDLIS